VVKHTTGIELQGAPVMIHDMAISERHSLIFDMPVTFSIERVMNGGHAFDWEPANGTRVGIVPRYGDGSKTRWFDVQTGYIFHVFNAWDEGDEVVLEACRTPRTSILETSRDMQADEQARFHRYRFNLTSGKVSEERVGDIPVEFSRINETCVGAPTRYGYAARFHPTRGLLFDAVVKHDRQGDRREVVEFAADQFGQEFVFAPRVESRAEDDGYVVGFVHDERENATECWVIDAQKFTAGPVARIRTPHTVPYGFHSNWVPAADAAKQARG
jgi:carotenoid cleavage dioxygenase